MADSKRGQGSQLVSTDWLAANLGAPDLVVVDGSWYLPAMARDGRAEYLEAHIPGAVFFDIDEISDHSSSLPHMMPDPVAFSSAMRKLGIGDGMRVIVYDGGGLFSAPRVWWMFRAFGASEVFILDGGLPKWKAEGRALEDGAVSRVHRHFTARLDHSVVADLGHVRQSLDAQSHHVIDARPHARFRGDAPEPRDIPSGHMPGAISTPASDFVADGRLKPVEKLVEIFDAAGVDGSKPVITSCGSGVSAAILTLALAESGRRQGSLYDGSWTEWASHGDLPIRRL